MSLLLSAITYPSKPYRANVKACAQRTSGDGSPTRATSVFIRASTAALSWAAAGSRVCVRVGGKQAAQQRSAGGWLKCKAMLI